MRSDAFGHVRVFLDVVGGFYKRFEVFVCFGKVSSLVGGVRMRSDTFGCVRMHSDMFGGVWMFSEHFGMFWEIWGFLSQNIICTFNDMYCEVRLQSFERVRVS